MKMKRTRKTKKCQKKVIICLSRKISVFITDAVDCDADESVQLPC